MKPYLFLATLALVACSGNQQHKPGSATAPSTDVAPNAISFPIDITPVEPAPAPSMNQTNFMTTPPAQPMNMAPPADMAPSATPGTMNEPMGTTAPAPMHSATPVLITPEVTVTPGTAVVTPPPSGPVIITPGTSSGPVVTSPPPTPAPAPTQPAAAPTASASDTQVSDALNMISVEAAANQSAAMSQASHQTPAPSTTSPAAKEFNAQVQSAKSQVVTGGSGS